MSVLGDAVQKFLDDALSEAIKSRFANIAANELTEGDAEGERELRATFQNLKKTHEQAVRIAAEVFG